MKIQIKVDKKKHENKVKLTVKIYKIITKIALFFKHHLLQFLNIDTKNWIYYNNFTKNNLNIQGICKINNIVYRKKQVFKFHYWINTNCIHVFCIFYHCFLSLDKIL